MSARLSKRRFFLILFLLFSFVDSGMYIQSAKIIIIIIIIITIMIILENIYCRFSIKLCLQQLFCNIILVWLERNYSKYHHTNINYNSIPVGLITVRYRFKQNANSEIISSDCHIEMSLRCRRSSLGNRNNYKCLDCPE